MARNKLIFFLVVFFFGPVLYPLEQVSIFSKIMLHARIDEGQREIISLERYEVYSTGPNWQKNPIFILKHMNDLNYLITRRSFYQDQSIVRSTCFHKYCTNDTLSSFMNGSIAVISYLILFSIILLNGFRLFASKF